MGQLREIVSGILTWPWFSEPHGYDFNGYLVRDPHGNVCIDPVAPGDDGLETLAREGVASVVIHCADAAYARSQGAAIDGDLAPGERVGPLVVLGVPGKSPGEVAFHWPERRILIVGDAIIGNPPGACGFLREKVMDDPPRLRASVRELLALDFDVLLVGDGTSILSGAKERVAALCASVPS